MKHALYFLLALIVTPAAIAVQTLQVNSSRGLRMGTVASAKLQTLAPVLADSMKKALTSSGIEMDLNVRTVGGDPAAFQLETGSLDAVIVFGRLPKALMTSGLYRLQAELPSNNGARIYLVYKEGNDSLKAVLEDVFPKAVNADAFLTQMHAANQG